MKEVKKIGIIMNEIERFNQDKIFGGLYTNKE